MRLFHLPNDGAYLETIQTVGIRLPTPPIPTTLSQLPLEAGTHPRSLRHNVTEEIYQRGLALEHNNEDHLPALNSYFLRVQDFDQFPVLK